MLALQIQRTGKGAAQVAGTLFPRQADLWGGGANAFRAVWRERKVQIFRHDFRQFQSLIEAALPESQRVQRHCNQDIRAWSSRYPPRQGSRERRKNGQLVAVFKRLNQGVERKAIGENRQCAVESRCMLQAMTAKFSGGGGQGAARALRSLVPGQVGVARRA